MYVARSDALKAREEKEKKKKVVPTQRGSHSERGRCGFSLQQGEPGASGEPGGPRRAGRRRDRVREADAAAACAVQGPGRAGD